MAVNKEEVDVLDGFSSIITGKNMLEGMDNADINIPFVEPDEIPTDEDMSVEETTDEVEEVETIEPEDEVEEIIKQNRSRVEKKPENAESTDTDDDPETEEMISQLLQERLASSLNYEFGEDEKFGTVKEVVDFLENLVSEASTPSYANEEVAKLDEFVKDGGNLKDYFDRMYERDFDINNVDLSDPSDQKRVIREALKEQGVKEDIISKRIERYENNEVLDEEAIEAQDFLLENKTVKEQKLLKAQKEQATQLRERQRDFVSSVEQTIDKMTDVFGTKLTAKEKMELKPYILRPTPDGMTKYQKEYMDKDRYINNLITSAYLTMKGETFVKRVKEQATSDTYKNIQKKLRDKKDTKISGSGNQTSNSNNLDLGTLGRFITRLK